MINNNLMYTVIVDRLTHPRTLTEVWVEDVVKGGAGLLAVNVRDGEVIGTLSGVQKDATIDIARDAGVETNDSVAVTTALQFAMWKL